MFEQNLHRNKEHFVVLFVQDSFLDIQAEMRNVKTKLSGYDTVTEFESYAEDFFEQFNARQIHYILLSSF
jgi:hypothetical protein